MVASSFERSNVWERIISMDKEDVVIANATGLENEFIVALKTKSFVFKSFL